MKNITRQQLAHIGGVSPQTVSKELLPKETDGRYSLENKDVMDWIVKKIRYQFDQNNNKFDEKLEKLKDENYTNIIMNKLEFHNLMATKMSLSLK